MEGRKIKKSVVYAMYLIAFVLVLGSIYLMELSSSANFQDEELPLTYVSKSIFDETLNVVAPVETSDKVIQPFTSDKVKVKKSFYDYTGESTSQENAIIYYENTYMQSTGIAYTGSEAFDVVAISDGTVISVTEDELLGNIVQIKHDNGLISVYQCVKDVNVSVNDVVKKGDVIAQSGISNLFPDDENQLYFEIIMDGKNINPSLCYDRTISEIKG